MTEVETRQSGLGTGAVVGMIAGFVVVGAPMVYYLWTTLNEVLSGVFDGARLAISAVVLLLFIGLLTILSRSVRRL